jgi:hypothetical protein
VRFVPAGRRRVVQAFFAERQAPSWLSFERRALVPENARAGSVATPGSSPRAFRPPPGFLRGAQGSGSTLPSTALRAMERLFDSDLSFVRVHVDHEASRIGALSFASGNDIYMTPGEFAPATARGAALLAYELSHVLQQRAGRVKNPFDAGIAIIDDAELELEAEQNGSLAAVLRARPETLPHGVAQPFLAGLSGNIRQNPVPWGIAASVVVVTGLGLAAHKYWTAPTPTPTPTPTGRYTYPEIREKYDWKLGLGKRSFLTWTWRVDVDCNELAKRVNKQWQTAIAMMQDVQRRAMGCTFRFVPAKDLIVELKRSISPTRVENFEDEQLFGLFCEQVELLHTTGGSSSLTEFLVAKIKESDQNFKKPDHVVFRNTETVLLPNYVCQIFVELLKGVDQKQYVQLGSTNELDWVLFGNNLSVFFSLIIGKHLKRNNSSQKLEGRLAVLKPLVEFGQTCFWMGPDLLSLSKAFVLDPGFVKQAVEQTLAPYGTGRELAQLLYWQAVSKCAGDTPRAAWHYYHPLSGDEVDADFLDAPGHMLEVISYLNKLNTDNLPKPSGKLKLCMDDADKLEIKALGLVPRVDKKPVERLGIK